LAQRTSDESKVQGTLWAHNSCTSVKKKRQHILLQLGNYVLDKSMSTRKVAKHSSSEIRHIFARHKAKNRGTMFMLSSVRKRNYLDYIAIWFLKAGNTFAGSRLDVLSFPLNSITQGVQVATLWPRVLKDELEIFFAHTSFKWQNNAKKNAAVICVVIGLRNIVNREKVIFSDGMKMAVQNINGYLAAAGTAASAENAARSTSPNQLW
jgi:hypothetical protein